MTYLSEDPTFLVGGLLLVAGAFAAALRVTQEGKYLMYATVALVLALGVLVVEQLWVTDSERIEQVVYSLRNAVANSNVDGVLGHMTRDVLYTHGDVALSPEETRSYIRAALSRVKFEMVQVTGLEIKVGEQSRRGTASFRVFAKGSMDSSLGPVPQGTSLTAWSLGLRETEPDVWMVYRIAPVQIPNDLFAPPNATRGEWPRLVAPDRGEGRGRRNTTHGGHGGDPRFFSKDVPGDAQPGWQRN